MKGTALACGLCVAVVVAAHAAEPAASAPSPDTTVGEITTLRNQIAVLKEQLEIAKLKAGIKAATTPSAPGQGQGPVLSGYPGGQTTPSGPQGDTRLPRVLSVAGRGSHLSATLELPGGGEVIAYPGLGLPGGLTVHDVTAQGVRVMKAGSLKVLPFADGEHDDGRQQIGGQDGPIVRPLPMILPGMVPAVGGRGG